jgi:hypothetical protein
MERAARGMRVGLVVNESAYPGTREAEGPYMEQILSSSSATGLSATGRDVTGGVRGEEKGHVMDYGHRATHRPVCA